MQCHRQQYHFRPFLTFFLLFGNWIPFRFLRRTFFCFRKSKIPFEKKDTLRQGVKDFHSHLPESHFSREHPFLARDSINSKPLPYRPWREKTRLWRDRQTTTKVSRGWMMRSNPKICYPFDEISKREMNHLAVRRGDEKGTSLMDVNKNWYLH